MRHPSRGRGEPVRDARPAAPGHPLGAGAVVVGLVLTACGAAAPDASTGPGQREAVVTGPVELERAVESPEEDVVSALQDPAAAELADPAGRPGHAGVRRPAPRWDPGNR